MIRGYPSLFLLVFVIAGIAAGNYLNLSPLVFLTAAAGGIGLAAVAHFRKHQTAVALFIGLSLGMTAAMNFGLQFRGAGPNHLRQILVDPTLCEVFGQVDDWPELKRGRTEITIELDSLAYSARTRAIFRKVDGRLLLKITDTTTALQRGDRIAFQGRLYPVRAGEQRGFDYGRYLNLRGIFAQAFLPTVLGVHVDQRPQIGFLPLVDNVRDAMRDALDRNLDLTESSLARGFLFGETRDIPPDVYVMFRDSGTLHLLAVSGANVALIILFSLWVMRPFWLGPRTRSIVLLIVIAVFAGVSYGDPSVMRASVMAILILGARLLGRPYDLNNIIATAALIILLLRPAQLFDVGFQLSFVTAWGLIFAVPRLSEVLKPDHERIWYRWLMLPLLIALVAQLFSSPLIVLYFERFPLVSLVANLVIVPMVSGGVIAILGLLVADLIWPLLGALVGGVVNLWLNGVLLALNVFGGDNIPVMQIGLPTTSFVAPLIVLVAYFLLILAVVAFKHTWARRTLIIAVAVVTNIALAARVVGSLGNDKARVIADRVPGGVAVLAGSSRISSADLILTGLSRTDYSSDESVLAPLLRRNGIEKLRYLIVLSADFDAVDDILRLTRTFSVDTLWLHRDLSRIVNDVRVRQAASTTGPEVLFFGGQAVPVVSDGYYPGETSLSLLLGESRIDIVDRPTLDASVSTQPGAANVLVIGSRWIPAADDWIRLHRAGYDKIVCASFEQRSQSVWPDVELNPDAVPPDYIHDLYRHGPIRLNPAL